MSQIFANTCTCGRRAQRGSTLCERCAQRLDAREKQRPSDAERLIDEPWRRRYDSAEYRRNRRLVLARAGGRCEMPECDRPLGRKPQVDHVIALRDGGDDSVGNLRAVCGHCHGRKTWRDRKRRPEG